MPLFGEDMVQVVTPDGRQITMPRQLAAAFPSLQPPSAPSVPDQGPVLSPMQAPAPPPPQPEAALNAPVTSPSQIPPPSEGPRAPRGPVTSPAEPPPGHMNTPAPMTNDQLAKLGNAGGYNAEQAAVGEQRTANQKQGEALANQATAVGNAMATADQHARQLLEERKRAAEENAAALQAKTDEYLRNAKAIADTKIDRSIDHPVVAALGVALTAIGNAMQHKSDNPMNAVYQAIDRKVAGQIQDLDQRRAGLALQKDALGMQRQAGMDKLAELDTYRLAAIDQARRQVETIKQQTSSDVVRANAQIVDADLAQKGAALLNTSIGREQQKREAEAARQQAMAIHRESMGVQIRGQNMEQDRFNKQLEFQKNKSIDEIAEKIALAQGKQKDEVAKKLSEQGVVDPKTGDMLLTPDGEKKLSDADKAEARARASTDPAQAKKLNDYAAQLRDSARTNDYALALNKKGAEEAQKILGASQNIATDARALNAMLEGGPQAFNREEWAKIVTRLQNVKVDYAQTIGERVSVKALDALESVLSIDPDSMWSRTVDKGKAMAALKELDTQVQEAANTALRGTGIKGVWSPSRGTATKDDFAGLTSQEIADRTGPSGPASAVGGWLGERGAIDRPPDVTEQANARKNAKGQTSDYGLDPAVDDKVREKITRSATVGHKQYNEIVESLAQPLQAGRPSQAAGVAKLIRDQDEKLFADVMAKLPAPARDELAQAIAPPSVGPRSGPLTPGARSELAYKKARLGMGLPADEPPTTPLTGGAGTAPPAIWSQLTAAGRDAYNQYLQSHGFPPVSAP